MKDDENSSESGEKEVQQENVTPTIDNSSEVNFDFREFQVPQGIEIVQGENGFEFIPQKDGSSAFRVSQGTYLKSHFNLSAVGGKKVNDYTITMDICLENLPLDTASIFHASGDSTKLGEGEMSIYSGGGVGIFGEVGVPEAAIHENKWTRVVISVGNQTVASTSPPVASTSSTPSTSSSSTSNPTSSLAPNSISQQSLNMRGGGAGGRRGMYMERRDPDEEDDLEEDLDLEMDRRGRGRGRGGGGRFLSRDPGGFRERMMVTYVNSRKCSMIKASTRGVVGIVDGRMALNPEGILFFASTRPELMPTILVKHIQVKIGCSSLEQVREDAQKNRIFSSWDRERKQELTRLHQNLTLQSLYPKPPPVWYHPALVAEFGDPFLEGTGLDGGDLSTASAFLSLTLGRIVLEASSTPSASSSSTPSEALRVNSLWSFDHSGLQAINALSEILRTSKDLCRRFALVLSQGNPGPQLIHFLKHVKKYLESLSEGQTLLLPGGIGSKTLVYLLERLGPDRYRFSVINTDAQSDSLQYHVSSAECPSKIKYQTVVSVDHVTRAKALDDVFWSMLFKLACYPSKQNTEEKLYNLLLPFLVDKPFEQILAESSSKDEEGWELDWRSPQRCSIAYYRSLYEASHYILRRRGFSMIQCRQFFFALRGQMFYYVSHDLGFLGRISSSERRLIRICGQQLAYSAVKLGKVGLLSDEILQDSKRIVDYVERQLTIIPCPDLEQDPPKLDLEPHKSDPRDAETTLQAVQFSTKSVSKAQEIESEVLLHPFLDRLLRKDDVDGLAGAPIVLPKYVPVDFLQLPRKVTSLEDAVLTIRLCDRLSTLISVQSHCVKNQAFQIVSLVNYTMTQLLPMPKAPFYSDYHTCIWLTPMRYGLQLDLVICLGRILEHFIASVYSLHATKSLDALKLIVPACIAALADVILRKEATDQPSQFCMHLMGKYIDPPAASKGVSRHPGFGLSLGKFAIQSETIQIHHPELSIARTAVLDYFSSQTRTKKIFNWEDKHRFEETTAEFLSRISTELAFPQGSKPFIGYMTARNTLINKNYPEFHVYRDISFYLKFVQNCDPRAAPPKPTHMYPQSFAELSWNFDQGRFQVEAFGRFPMMCFAGEPYQNLVHRYPSSARPSYLAQPHEIRTEDDVLHIKNLPSFKDSMGQQDVELLLSYLTVPYLRIPLILSMFATEDRIHSLKSDELQLVLDSVLFEPSTYLTESDAVIPTHVPCPDRKVLATPYGLLLNELCHSPEILVNSILSLAKLAVNLDVGTIHSTTVPIILYVLRMISRVDSYISFLIQHSEGRHETIDAALRNLTLSEETHGILVNARVSLLHFVNEKVIPMLEAWNEELVKESNNHGTDDKIVDRNAKIACRLHAHLLLLCRNIESKDYDFEIASILCSSMVYLTTRHTWNLDLLIVPEHEMFEIIMVQRRKLVSWIRTQSGLALNSLMESTIRVTVGTGPRKIPNLIEGVSLSFEPTWAFLGGDRSSGRFTLSNTKHIMNRGVENAIPLIDPSSDLGVELDLQISQMTLKSSHLQALETDIAADRDVQLIFGSKSMQASTVQSTEHRLWVHLVGRGHDVQYWKTPDPRPCIQEFDRDYSPGEVHPSEEWIVPLLEPVRLTYMTQPFVLQICLPEAPSPPDSEIITLVGIHPKMGGTWKEIFVFRSLQMVQVYQVLSHGRRFYRVLEYTSNVKYSLRDLQPSLDSRQQPWPHWERHGAGHPYADHWKNPLSCVITRKADYHQNLSCGTETFIPERLLYGLVPNGLLERFLFWQDEDDNLKGYPKDPQSPYLIEVLLHEKVKKVPTTKLPGTCGKIRRVLKHQVEARVAKRNQLISALAPIAADMKQKIESPIEETEDDANMHITITAEDEPTPPTTIQNPVEEKEDQWEFDFKAVKRLARLVDSGVSISETIDFMSALQSSGVVYESLDILLSEVEQFALDQGPCSEFLEAQALSLKTASTTSIDQAEALYLLNIGFSVKGSKFFGLLQTISRMENASYILCWSRQDPSLAQPEYGNPTYSSSEDIQIDLIEFSRLNMSFHQKLDDHGVPRIFSMDHVNLFISNARSDLTTKLMTGAPHSLLMSTSNGELQILIPTIDPVRPAIGSSPFTTELVMNRSESPDWYGALESSYQLYPVHVSLSFLFSPTLSAALYLLLIRFLYRSYEEAFRLISTIGTDTEFSPEENIIFLTLGRSNGDCHPDALACRMKIAHVTLDAPIVLPFDLTQHASRYISKLSHVSTACRLTTREELQLLEKCVCDWNDPRFFDPETGAPKYSMYEVTLIKNRKYYLRELLSHSSSELSAHIEAMISSNSMSMSPLRSETFLPIRTRGTRWTVDRNLSALMLDESSFQSMEVSYSAPPQLSGHAALDLAHKYWPGMEDMSGHAINLGFLFLYEILTGTKQVKIFSEQFSHSFATLMFELMGDKAIESIPASLLSLLIKYPQLAEKMPKFKDDRKFKNPKIAAIGDDNDPVSPLGRLLTQALQVLQDEIGDLIGEAPAYEDSPADPLNHCFISLDDLRASCFSEKKADLSVSHRPQWIVPNVSDYSCKLRVLSELTAATLSEENDSLGPTATVSTCPEGLHLSPQDIDSFSRSPLAPLDVSTRYIQFYTRSDSQLEPVNEALPFDVSHHNQAKSAVAVSMIDRLQTDMHEYATSKNTGTQPKINFLLGLEQTQNELTRLSQRVSSSPLAPELPVLLGLLQTVSSSLVPSIQSSLSQFVSEFEGLRDLDSTYVNDSIPWLFGEANSLRSAQKDGSVLDTTNDRERLIFSLNKYSGQEPTIWLEYLFATLLSSRQIGDLRRMNPFLGSQSIRTITSVMVGTILHANRIGLINRSILFVRDLEKSLREIGDVLHKLQSTLSSESTSSQEDSAKVLLSQLITSCAAVALTGESLARMICTGRYYMDEEYQEGEPDEEEEQFSEMERGSFTLPAHKKQRMDSFVRCYDPRFLLFEFTWNIMLRKSQVEMVRDYISSITKGKSMVKQMIMGAGKTTVVCPLLTLMLGDGQNLILQVVPPALLEFSRSVMRSTFSSIMHKRIFTLSFDRSSSIDTNTNKKLFSAIESRGVVIATPTTVKSIMLKFIELMNIISDDSVPRTPEVEFDCAELGRTLGMFKDSILIMDEVDLILHPMKSELNFPIGAKHELDLSPQRWLLPIHLMDSIFYCEKQKMTVAFKESSRAHAILHRLDQIVKRGFQQRALQRNPHIVLLNLEWYFSDMVETLSEWLYIWLEAQHLSGIPEASIRKYLVEGANSNRNADLMQEIENRLTPNQKKLLNLGHDWLTSYLPHVLQKIDRVSFGIMNEGDYSRAIKDDPHMPRTRAKLAIPFVGKDVPSRSSEFAHPDVILGLTILAYRYEGLRWTDFEDLITNLRSTLTREMGPWKQRKSNLRFVKWVLSAGGNIRGEEYPQLKRSGSFQSMTDDEHSPMVTSSNEPEEDKVVVSLRLLKRSNEDQMKKIFNLIRMLPEAIHFYLENFIFPVYTDNKIVKLSAAGQELGGELLFRRRIGFSGTPSDLLPVELGKCGYERCSDGEMIHVLTTPEVCSYEVVTEGWSATSLLSMIANAVNPTTGQPLYHALIDTGALITGLTNFQVARKLLDLGLPWCEGVVFLDEYDRKMILVRATGRVLKMAQCGIPANKRFAFYDQVHTTGMDISHVLDATAVLTLSKDMVFRDLAQGAYRMRGISRGQRIHFLVIPEVRDLIIRELCKRPGNSILSAQDSSLLMSPSLPVDTRTSLFLQGSGPFSSPASSTALRCITAWLVINSMKSERVQFNQLCLQNVSNVWRKNAFSNLLSDHQKLKISLNYSDPSVQSQVSGVLDSLSIFSEPIDFSLEECVPNPTLFSESILMRADKFSRFISSEEERKVVQEVVEIVSHTAKQELDTPSSSTPSSASSVSSFASSSGDSDVQDNEFLYQEKERLLGAEMVQEQEREQEQEQEEEQEQEIEIEKYVDLAYSREHEEPTPWPFQSLSTPLDTRSDLSLTQSFDERSLDHLPSQFYHATDFKLYKRRPLNFPTSLLISNNYFDKRWSGARRIKNTVMVLDWVPKQSNLVPMTTSLLPLSPSQEASLETAISLVQQKNNSHQTSFGLDLSMDMEDGSVNQGLQGELTVEQVQQIIRSAVHLHLSLEEVGHLIKNFSPPTTSQSLSEPIPLTRSPSLKRQSSLKMTDQSSLSQLTSPRDVGSPLSSLSVPIDLSALRMSCSALKDLLASGILSPSQRGRKFVALSLAEAETIRCILHRKSNERLTRGPRNLFPSSSEPSSSMSIVLTEREGEPAGEFVIEGSETTLALRCLPAHFAVIDKSMGYTEAGAQAVLSPHPSSTHLVSCPYMTDAACESLRFLNCDLFFSERSLNVLLRALHFTSTRDRRLFFKNILACRRRQTKKWSESPVAKAFLLADHFNMLKQRAFSLTLKASIKSQGMLLYDFFTKFNFSKNGYMTPGEVWAGFTYLGIEMAALDVLEFLHSADADRDGSLSYRELVDILQDPDRHSSSSISSPGKDVDSPDADDQENNIEESDEQFNVPGSGGGVVSGSADLPGSPISLSRTTSLRDVASPPSADDAPPLLRRQASLTIHPPRGEEELRELELSRRQQEEAEEREEAEQELLEEERIKMELDAEEDQKDLLQEGGRNPRISEDSIYFDFTTGRLPRRVQSRGDVNYFSPEGPTASYLKVFPKSCIFLSTPFSENCGGSRLNQYTLSFSVMLEALPPPGTPLPLFSAATHAQSDALVYVDSNGRFSIPLVTNFSSGENRTVFSAKKWVSLNVVVDLIEEYLNIYVDGELLISGSGSSSSALHFDGVFSLSSQFSLFGCKNTDASLGACTKHVSLHSYCLEPVQISELHHALKREGEKDIVSGVVSQLVVFGVDPGFARWAAENALGSTVEERLANAMRNLGMSD